jgi:hypothetical protein
MKIAHLFPTVVEAEMSRKKMLVDLVSGEGHFLSQRWHLFAVSSHDGRDEVLFRRALILFMRSSLPPNHHLPTSHHHHLKGENLNI